MSGYWGVVPAAGSGDRFGADTPKQYTRVAGACVLEHSLAALLRTDVLRGVVVSLAADDTLWPQTRYCNDARVMNCRGGASRTQSVMNALEFLRGRAAEDDWILVHDAVRPCLSARDLAALTDALDGDEVGGLLVAPVSDTLKKIGEKIDGRIDAAADRLVVKRTLERGCVMRALTPQMFRFGLLDKAIGDVLRDGVEIGDEAQAMELAGHAVRVVAGDGANIKLTYPHELPLLETWLVRHAPQDRE